MNLISIYKFSLIILCLNVSWTIQNDHQVTDFTIPEVNFDYNHRHYSGYLGSYNETYLHYWFFESQSNPETDPVVLWLKGGPGCSSLVSAVSGSGPFLLHQNGSLTLNPYTWNTQANILYLESPVGVGFSYEKNNPNFSSYTPNDNNTAHLNFGALSSFFAKFPHLSSNNFYISGTSYSGVYIPTLSMLILENQFPLNFKGIIIGNALLDNRLVISSRFQYAYDHGLFVENESDWTNFTSNCCPEPFTTFRECFFHNYTYDSYLTMPDSTCKQTLFRVYLQIIAFPTNMYYVKEACTERTPWNACVNQSDYLNEFFNRADVQKALNVDWNNSDVKWIDCNDTIVQNYGYRDVFSVQQEIDYLLKRSIKVVLYFGDADLVCTYISGQWFIDDLNLTENESSKLEEYFYANQLAGYTRTYPKELTYYRIIDAGHNALKFKPEVGQNIFREFVESTLNIDSKSSSSGYYDKFCLGCNIIFVLILMFLFLYRLN